MARALFVIAALAVWEGLAWLSLPSVLLASPSGIATYIANNASLLGRALLATAKTASLGFLWGNLAALVLATLVILAPRIERLIQALALLVFCLPLVATGPILRVLYGTGEGPQITLAALAVYYTTFLALMVGLRAIPQNWSDLIRLYGRTRLSELVHIRAMACLPYLIAGLQIAAPAAILGAMIGEFTGAERGLGVLTLRAMRSLNVEATWTLALISAALSILAFWAIGRIAKRGNFQPALLLTPRQTLAHTPWLTQLAQATLITLIVLAIWQISMDAFALNRFFAKRPGDIWDFLITSQTAATNRATLLTALWETLSLTVPGYLAGLLLGAGLAAALVLKPALERTALPLAIALRAIPIITTAPLLVLALGRGAMGTITIVAVMIFFPTLIACLQGLRQTPGQVVDMFQSYAASPMRLLISARLPAMLPAFFASARMAIPAALLAVTTAEWLATGKGIGTLMALTATTSNYNMLWSAVVALSLVAVALFVLLARLELRILRIYASEQVTR